MCADQNRVLELEIELKDKTTQLETLKRELEEERIQRVFFERRFIYNRETGLPNHYLLTVELEERIQEGVPFHLVVIALNDNFNTIKRTLNPKITEWILYQSAERIKGKLPGNSLLYHTKENEFIAYVPTNRNYRYARKLALSLQKAVEGRHNITGYSLSVGAEVGVVIHPTHGEDKGTLLRKADLVVSAARQNFKGIKIYSDEINKKMVERLHLQDSILKALEAQALSDISRQFSLYFQPQLKVSRIYGEEIEKSLLGAEVLIRWNHPERGMISPTKFIPLAEETGLIIPISNWILFNAGEKLKYWESQGLDITLSINISPYQFRYEDIVSTISHFLKKKKIAPEKIKLEITENGLMDHFESTIPKLTALRKMGVKIQIDDFGTGYSSLSYLKILPVDTIKIDKSFLYNLLQNRQSQMIVKAIISLAREMKLTTICEGVETLGQLQWLYNQGCDEIQGYYFSKPLAEEDFLEYVKSLET